MPIFVAAVVLARRRGQMQTVMVPLAVPLWRALLDEMGETLRRLTSRR